MRRAIIISLLIYHFLTLASHAAQPEVIRVGIRPGAPPFCFLSTKDGKVSIRGIDVDLMTMIQKTLRVKLKYINTSSLEQGRQQLVDGQIDVIALEPLSPGGILDISYIPVDFTTTRHFFVHETCRTVVCSRDLPNQRVAVIEGDHYELFTDEVGRGNLVIFQSYLEALKMLNNGEVDVFISPAEIVAQYLIQKERLEYIVKVGVAIEEIKLALAVRADNTQLQDRLTQAVERLRQAGVFKLLKDKWYGVPLEVTPWQKYYKYFIAVIVTVILVLTIVFFWNYQLKTKVKAVTNELSTSEKKYRRLIESSPDMIFLVTPEGDIQHANTEARAMMLVHDETKSLPNLVDLIVAEQRDDLTTFLETVFSFSSGSREFRFRDAQVRVKDVDVAATRILAETAESPLACCFARDVTDRNRIEQELIQTDRLATIGKMAAGIAHEINNPLGIVRANIELISSQGWLADEAAEFIESMRRNTIRAGKITQDLLAVAKPKQSEMAEVDLWELVKMTLAIIGPQFKETEIRKETRGEPAIVLGDRNLLQQVLVNLFLNAGAAMKDCSQRKIYINCCVPPGETTARLRIKDSGKGIPIEHLNEVFEPFFTHGKQEGFGLGLFISRRIIERHGGIIFAESENGMGANVIIELPLYDHSPDSQSASVAESAGV